MGKNIPSFQILYFLAVEIQSKHKLSFFFFEININYIAYLNLCFDSYLLQYIVNNQNINKPHKSWNLNIVQKKKKNENCEI